MRKTERIQYQTTRNKTISLYKDVALPLWAFTVVLIVSKVAFKT